MTIMESSLRYNTTAAAVSRCPIHRAAAFIKRQSLVLLTMGFVAAGIYAVAQLMHTAEHPQEQTARLPMDVA